MAIPTCRGLIKPEKPLHKNLLLRITQSPRIMSLCSMEAVSRFGWLLISWPVKAITFFSPHRDSHSFLPSQKVWTSLPDFTIFDPSRTGKQILKKWNHWLTRKPDSFMSMTLQILWGLAGQRNTKKRSWVFAKSTTFRWWQMKFMREWLTTTPWVHLLTCPMGKWLSSNVQDWQRDGSVQGGEWAGW